ncbi:MAG: PEP-CTERM sorting domain-containing protein [Sedimentisphaerales bacterium]
MMKRVLALMLVLGLASSAGAIYLEIDGTPTNTYELVAGYSTSITIVSEDDSSWLGYLIVPEGSPGTLSNPSIFDNAGNFSSANPYTESGWGTGYELTAAMTFEGVPPLAAGEQFSFDFSGGLLGDTAQVLLFLDPEYSTPAGSLSISIVPEPITIALLGFGTLFLRRRK